MLENREEILYMKKTRYTDDIMREFMKLYEAEKWRLGDRVGCW